MVYPRNLNLSPFSKWSGPRTLLLHLNSLHLFSMDDNGNYRRPEETVIS
jgi:hypothetical protein